MQNNEFKTYHPIVNFIYFVLVIGFSCVFMHPICLCISLFSVLVYSTVLNVGLRLKYMLPMFIGVAILNPLFSHEGATILMYFPGGNPLTLESIIYGIAASTMLISVICWFFCYNEVMTSDKFIFLFGRAFPSLSLVLSMTFRFVPMFIRHMKIVSDSQKTMGKGVFEGGIVKRLKNAGSILSIMISWSLENAIDTADSMKSRGYGIRKRTSFSIFTISKRDIKVLTMMVVLVIYIIIGVICDGMYFKYFPLVKYDISAYSISVFLAYLVFCFIPLIIEMWEVRKWKYIMSKI